MNAAAVLRRARLAGGAVVVLGMLVASAAPALAIPYPPNDKYFANQWNLKTILAPQAWTKATGAGVVVAVVDSGVAFTADLANASAGSYNCMSTGTNCVASSGDDYGHGTNVASVLAAQANNSIGMAGVAPDAKILSIQVVGTGGTAKATDIANGVEFAADHGAKVINMSLGGDGSGGSSGFQFDCPYPPCLSSFQTSLKQALQPAADYAAARGALVVVAAGNSGPAASDFMGMNNVLIVGATGPGDEVASYSSTGSGANFVYAPGGDGCSGLTNCIVMQTSLGQFVMNQGTSFATPEVAGVAALLAQQGITGSAAASRIVATADHVAAGLRLNAAAAVGAPATLPGPTSGVTIVPSLLGSPSGSGSGPGSPAASRPAPATSTPGTHTAPAASNGGTGAGSGTPAATTSPAGSPPPQQSPAAGEEAAPEAAAALAKAKTPSTAASSRGPLRRGGSPVTVLALMMFLAGVTASGMVWFARHLRA